MSTAQPELSMGSRAVSEAAGSHSRFVGSKSGSGVWQRIITEIPKHRVWIEPFAGRAAICRAKLPADFSYLCELGPKTFSNLSERFASDASAKVIWGDGVQFLAGYPYRGDECVYADPPYLGSVRLCPRKYYEREMMTVIEHSRLLSVLQSLPCPVILSGYRSALYDSRLADWRTIDIPTTNRAGKRVTETIWLNFPDHIDRHDTRYAGLNFTDRQRVKRLCERWQKKLSAMPEAVRQAVILSLSAGGHSQLCGRRHSFSSPLIADFDSPSQADAGARRGAGFPINNEST